MTRQTRQLCRDIEHLSRPIGEPETRRLIGLAKAGDLAARNRIVETNLRWIVGIAGRFSEQAGIPTCCEPDDLVQAGVFGVIRAIEKFDLARPVKFLTYATFWIKQSIRSHVRDHRFIVRVPVYIQEECPDHAAITANETRKHLGDHDVVLSRSDDIAAIDNAEELEFQYRGIAVALGQLSAVQLTVIRRRTAGVALREIGEKLNLTRQRINQIETEALRVIARAVGRRHPAHDSLCQRAARPRRKARHG